MDSGNRVSSRWTCKENHVRQLQSIPTENLWLKRELAAKDTEPEDKNAQLFALTEQVKEMLMGASSRRRAASLRRQLDNEARIPNKRTGSGES